MLHQNKYLTLPTFSVANRNCQHGKKVDVLENEGVQDRMHNRKTCC